MNTPFVKIQGTLFNLDGIVSVRIDDSEAGGNQVELLVETRLKEHSFDYDDAKSAQRVLDDIVAKLKAGGYDVPALA